MTPPGIVGIDLGKNWFHLVGLDEAGATILRKKLNRAQLAEYAATAPRCIVATESCPGSQYWGRVHRSRARGADPASAIREALSESQQKRVQ
jgi:transposase